MACRAFHHDPFFEFLDPGPLRARGLGLFFRAALRALGSVGQITGARQADGRLMGVAAWIPPGHYPLSGRAQGVELLGGRPGPWCDGRPGCGTGCGTWLPSTGLARRNRCGTCCCWSLIRWSSGPGSALGCRPRGWRRRTRRASIAISRRKRPRTSLPTLRVRGGRRAAAPYRKGRRCGRCAGAVSRDRVSPSRSSDALPAASPGRPASQDRRAREAGRWARSTVNRTMALSFCSTKTSTMVWGPIGLDTMVIPRRKRRTLVATAGAPRRTLAGPPVMRSEVDVAPHGRVQDLHEAGEVAVGTGANELLHHQLMLGGVDNERPGASTRSGSGRGGRPWPLPSGGPGGLAARHVGAGRPDGLGDGVEGHAEYVVEHENDTFDRAESLEDHQ